MHLFRLGINHACPQWGYLYVKEHNIKLALKILRKFLEESRILINALEH